MAVWLSLSLSQGTPNETARTTTVTATLTIHYSAGSYNGYSPPGQIVIDGQTFDFTQNYNYAGIGQGAVTTGTGSTSVSRTATVEYGSSSTRTVSATAWFESGSSVSGTVYASDSIALTSISSGGSSGGGDDNNDDEEGGGSGSGTTTSEAGIIIANGSKFEGYGCYIDTYAVTNKVTYSYELTDASGDVKFVTPHTPADYVVVTAVFSTLYVNVGDTSSVDITVSLLDANNTLIAESTISYDSDGRKSDVRFTLRPTTPLEPKTECSITTSSYGGEISGTIDQLYVTGESTSIVNDYLEYEPYIDNGTSWFPYT